MPTGIPTYLGRRVFRRGRGCDSDIDQERLQDLVDESGRSLALRFATDVLIIEDEMVIALVLNNWSKKLGHRPSESLAPGRGDRAVRVSRPGLILADIQLADGSPDWRPLTIYSIIRSPGHLYYAHPERFLTGERPEPAS